MLGLLGPSSKRHIYFTFVANQGRHFLDETFLLDCVILYMCTCVRIDKVYNICSYVIVYGLIYFFSLHPPRHTAEPATSDHGRLGANCRRRSRSCTTASVADRRRMPRAPRAPASIAAVGFTSVASGAIPVFQ